MAPRRARPTRPCWCVEWQHLSIAPGHAGMSACVVDLFETPVRCTSSSRPGALLRHQILFCHLLDRWIIQVHGGIVKHPATSTCNLQVDSAIYAGCDNGSLEDFPAPQDNACPLCIDIWADTDTEALCEHTVDASPACRHSW